ncbi:MAG TPA: hypothetical protein ENN43_01620 [bacterium]|nr:hypothetical protein [bacterium]
MELIIYFMVFAAAAGAVYLLPAAAGEFLKKVSAYRAGIDSAARKTFAEISGSELGRVMAVSAAVVLALAVLSGEIIILAAGAAALAITPRLYIKIKKDRFNREYYESIPRFLESVISSMKSGTSVLKSFQVFAGRSNSAVAKEISVVIKKIGLGKPLSEALQEMSDRVDVKENRIIVSAVIASLETGGNLTDVLENTLTTIRKRDEINREVKALTSQGVLSGIIVGLLPVFLLCAVYFIDPSFVEPLFKTGAGRGLLLAAFIMEVTGALIISRIVRVR